MPPSAIRLLLLVLSALFLSPRTHAQQALPKTESYTIESVSSYAFLRSCARCCFGGTALCFTASNILTNAVGCTINSCLCSRSDISTAALDHISSCVNLSCSGAGGDISVGQKVFNEYCDSYLGVANAGPVTDDSGSSSRGPPAGTVTVTVPLTTVTTTLRTATVDGGTTITSFIATNLENGQPAATSTVIVTAAGGLNSSDKVGLGVGLGIGLPILALAVVFGFAWARQRAVAYPPDIPGPHMDQIQG
ncbi:hypothetical protein TWF696_001703 [Orbilia brochopaga]|uniref:Mid2 domain-containing protein n=1 Tax=Orbilia brochopaga TaxID=3140254 RepID=A0AAV9U6A8_9PEZI